MMKPIIIALIAIAGTRQACAAGCLKCNTTGDCLIADVNKNYYLNGTSAASSTQQNCEILAHDGTCSFCSAGYYLNPTTFKCVTVPTASVVTSCQYYGSDISCSLCKTDYYLNIGACTAVTTKITGCMHYADATSCSVCNSGSLLSLDKKSCISAPNTAKCGDFSFVQCKTCGSGYVLNPNKYLDFSFNLTLANDKESLAEWAYELVDNYKDTIAQNACQEESTENCSDFDQGTNTCTSCSFGWFLDTDATCIIYPDEPIANCLNYSDKENCVECNASFYLKSKACIQITGTDLITNCASYDGSASTVKCLACANTHYLSSNSCVARVNTNIAGCTAYRFNADRCNTCSNSTVITTDGLKCNTAISGCAVHSNVSQSGTLTCTKCNSGLYLSTDDSTSCLAGTVARCDTYSNNSSTNCTLCENKYLLVDDACIAHNEITGCTEYSVDTLHFCNKCTDTANYTFAIDKKCQNITATLIDNCIEYEGTLDNPTCISCKQGFYLDSGDCKAIDIQGCVSQNADGCVTCAAGFAVSADKTECLPPFNFVTDQCEVHDASEENGETASGIKCQICKENAVPFLLEDSFVCMTKGEIEEYREGSVTLTANCIKYNKDFDCIQCDPNVTNKFLLNKACVADCGAKPYFKYILGNQLVSQYNVCFEAVVSEGIEGCLALAFGLTSSSGEDLDLYGCVTCKDTYFPVYNTESGYTNVDPTATDIKNFIPSPNFRYPLLACVAKDGNTIGGVSATRALVSNCDYYYLQSGVEYSCARCSGNRAGKFSIGNKIKECATVLNSDTQTLYNLDVEIAALTNVHKCTGTAVPHLFYKGVLNDDSPPVLTNQFGGFESYNENIDGGSFTDDANANNTISCRTINTFPFKFTNTDGKLTNCGLVVVLINSGSETDNSFCAACKPGYKATPDGVYPYKKTECIKIDNCSTTENNFFNGCSKCASNYILEFVAGNTKQIRYESCLPINTGNNNFDIKRLSHCYAAIKNDSNKAGDCAVCENGYYLNEDKYCEQILPSKCVAGNFDIDRTAQDADFEWYLWAYGSGNGCSRCEDSYISYQLDTNHDVCLNSPHVQSTVDSLTDTSKYVPNCKQYVANANSFVCKNCDPNFVIKGETDKTIIGDKCFSATKISNCAIATTDSNCVQCKDKTFGLVDNKCVNQAIDNCVAYNFDYTKSSVECVNCAPDYYLKTSNKACVLGNIRNCKILSDDKADECEECLEGYIILKNLGSGYDYCYPTNSALGCDNNLEIYPGLGKVSCGSCLNGENQLPALVPEDENKSICMPFSLIDKCISYHVDDSVSSSNFRCTECEITSYLSNNRCVTRQNIDNKCTVYLVDDDTCFTCDDTSYLRADKKGCTLYPPGIVGCMQYSNATTCIACKAGRYLVNNACPAVTTAIDNCSYYSNATTCSACNATYVLVNNACVKATATNCLTYSSVSACATCNSMYGLETNNNITSCVLKTKVGCAEIDLNTPFNCVECLSGYYLDAGACKSATVIAQCTAYDSATTCTLCNPGYALSVDRTACTNTGGVASFLDGNCDESVVVASPICTRCEPGYYFINGACTGSCNSGTASGCLACDPDTPSTCYICDTGFYQDKNGKCNPNVVTGSNASIMGVLTVLIALWAFVF